jgi:hypothetical protein
MLLVALWLARSLVVLPSASIRPSASDTTIADDPAVLWNADMEEGSLDDWFAPSSGRFGEAGGGFFDAGDASEAATDTHAHSGQHSLKATVSTTQNSSSAVRAFRWRESHVNRELFYSVWMYFPERFTLTADPESGQFWNLFQFKSRSTDGSNDPLWAFNALPDDNGDLSIVASWGWGGTSVGGPRRGDNVSGKHFSQSKASIPVGKWVHFEAFLRQSKDFDGTLTFWQDGVRLFNFSNVRTSYETPDYNDWQANNEWSVNLYTDGIAPSPATIYIDDAAISLKRL